MWLNIQPLAKKYGISTFRECSVDFLFLFFVFVLYFSFLFIYLFIYLFIFITETTQSFFLYIRLF